MIEPNLSLAFAVQSNPGVYAVLLGSGVSRSAGIPTGWEVVLDLTRRIAAMRGEDPAEDPAGWFRTTYGEEPDYSKLLDSLGRTPEERQQILRSCFEPTEEQREDGQKLPTAAHRAIASLMVKGYVRVAVTTNFDRLLERAIEDEGVIPVVISSPDAVEGTVPLVHQKCVVIKLHGDYLDTRIRNTPGESAKYDPKFRRLLERVLDEYGMIIAGWSGQWDVALAAAFERCRSHRFGTYWTQRGEPGERAKKIIASRRASLVPVRDADHFFADLNEKVLAVERTREPHAVSRAAAAATVKRLIQGQTRFIDLDDFIGSEVERCVANLRSLFARVKRNPEEERPLLLSALDGACGVLTAAVVPLAQWGRTQAQVRILVAAIQRLASERCVTPGDGFYGIEFRGLPALLLMQTAGIAALAAEGFQALVSILERPVCPDFRDRDVPLLFAPDWAIVAKCSRQVPSARVSSGDLGGWFYEQSRKWLAEVLPDDAEFERLLARFEIVRAITYAAHGWRDSGINRTPDGLDADLVWRLQRNRLPYQASSLGLMAPGHPFAANLLSAGWLGGDQKIYGDLHSRYLTPANWRS